MIAANEDTAALSAAQCRDLGDWYRTTVLPAAAPAVRQAVLQKTARYYERFLRYHEKKDTARMKVELALFNRALTPKELQQLRNFGREGRSLAD